MHVHLSTAVVAAGEGHVGCGLQDQRLSLPASAATGSRQVSSSLSSDKPQSQQQMAQPRAATSVLLCQWPEPHIRRHGALTWQPAFGGAVGVGAVCQ